MTEIGKSFKIGRFGSAMSEEIALPGNATINDAIAAADITVVKGETLAIDGEAVSGNYQFEDGDKIYVVPSTTGA